MSLCLWVLTLSHSARPSSRLLSMYSARSWILIQRFAFCDVPMRYVGTGNLQAFAFASAVAGLIPKYFWLTAESSMFGVLNSAISKNKVFIIFSIKTGCTRENHNSVLVAGINFCQIAETYFAWWRASARALCRSPSKGMSILGSNPMKRPSVTIVRTSWSFQHAHGQICPARS